MRERGADKKNLYYINSGVTFNDKEGEGKTGGMTYYKGLTFDGKMKQINIDIAPGGFPLNSLAHEFKHAHQYYQGRLIFLAGTKGGYDSKELEREAYERGDRFSGGLLINGNTLSVNRMLMYNVVTSTIQLPNTPSYNESPDKADMQQIHWGAKHFNLEIIENVP